MTTSIGPKGQHDLYAVEVGPQRKVRVVSFNGRSDTGAISSPHFRVGENPIAVIDMNFGRAVTASFSGVTATGEISQIDTGGLGGDGAMTNYTLWAIFGDTGTAGI